MAPTAKLFEPKQVGAIQLGNRVVMAPTTRFRADDEHVQPQFVAEYYSQRTKEPGTLVITEATYIGQKATGYAHAPGIWSDKQISSWKKVTDAVHANGSFIFLQLWALGRAADPDQLRKEGEGKLQYVGASSIKHPSHLDEDLHALTEDGIKEYISLYATAASNAVHKAGFDGVEIHGANGYLIDQFLQDVSNDRTDSYGGSIENRARFALEVTEAVTQAVGEERTGIRFSPWSTYNAMRMQDPKPQFSYVVEQLRDRYPKLAYVHLIEPRSDHHYKEDSGDSNDFLREIWGDRPLISAGGYTRELALEVAEKKGDIIAFSRIFIANPDLAYRLQHNHPLNVPDPSTFYGQGTKGYTDYPFVSHEL